jgi:hypothetical protein
MDTNTIALGLALSNDDGSLQNHGPKLGSCKFRPLEEYLTRGFPIVQYCSIISTKLTVIFTLGPVSCDAGESHQASQCFGITTRNNSLLSLFHWCTPNNFCSLPLYFTRNKIAPGD